MSIAGFGRAYQARVPYLWKGRGTHAYQGGSAKRALGRSVFAIVGPLEYPIGNMPPTKVAILRTTPATVLADYHRLMDLADYG